MLFDGGRANQSIACDSARIAASIWHVSAKAAADIEGAKPAAASG